MAGTEFTDELAGLLTGVPRLVRRRLRQGLTVPRLRGAQVELLLLVAATPGIRVSAAAKELCLAGNSVSTLVNQLVNAGLLRREVDPEDRRAALLLPTPEAAERLAAWTANRNALYGEQVARLPEADQAALAAALPALRRLAAALREPLPGTPEPPVPGVPEPGASVAALSGAGASVAVIPGPTRPEPRPEPELTREEGEG